MKRTSKDYFLVTLQMFLFALYLFEFFPKLKIPVFMSYAGIFVAVLGILIIVAAVLKLNKNLTAFPTPKEDSELVTTGVYRISRHPIYTGILLFVFGYALFKMSLFKLIISFILMLLFYFKTKYEEQQLLQKYPQYGNYQKRTGRFFQDYNQKTIFRRRWLPIKI